MTRDEALLMAIEAIENADYHNDLQAIEVIKDIMASVATNDTSQERVDKTSEIVHEPVAWVSSEELLVMRGNALGGAKDWRINVGLVKQDGDVGLYTTPPQRKPLTDEEIILIVAECAASHQHTDIHFARAIERAHGIKELV